MASVWMNEQISKLRPLQANWLPKLGIVKNILFYVVPNKFQELSMLSLSDPSGL